MIIYGDCLIEMAKMEENSIDFIVTDPPYGIHFMGKDWDGRIPTIEIWAEALRICKPGAMLAAFGGSRTHHHLMCAIEGAGWEIRDVIMWLFGQGFPKSHDVSKAIDNIQQAEREIIGKGKSGKTAIWQKDGMGDFDITVPSSSLAKTFCGYGTALKPAYEPIILAMKPLDGSFAQNAERWCVAGINVDESRIDSELLDGKKRHGGGIGAFFKEIDPECKHELPSGRWPANIIFDEEAAEILDQQSHINASRFFYCAKASSSERGKDNIHPTVKPLSLMKYLIKLLAPPGDPVLLDPFCGSGSTLVAAKELGIRAIGIEKQKGYCEIAQNRLNFEDKQLKFI